MPDSTTTIPDDNWDLSREYPDSYRDWQYEVANGDTLRGFREWFIAKSEE
jgi:hypothetical protein